MITDQIIEGAQLSCDVAPDIIFAAEAALLARGVLDAGELVPTLLAAAWTSHKTLHGQHNNEAFASLLRRWADGIDNASIVN
jgi:hypothetical protein